MEYEVLFPSKNGIAGVDLKESLSLLKEGKAVDVEIASNRLPEAIIAVIVRDNREIVGVGTIKAKRPKYASSIAKKSGYEFEPNVHELGYVVVKESHGNQGISKEIVQKLLDACEERPLFATTSRPYMKKTLEKNQFTQRGEEWAGDKEILSLWIAD